MLATLISSLHLALFVNREKDQESGSCSQGRQDPDSWSFSKGDKTNVDKYFM